ncbi:MAG: FAD-binding oxidoreductase [FCB group bacterium]|nr:FAD-binding oxidoreductase [FCB group bacterium]
MKSEFPDDRLTFQKGVATFHPESADEAAHFLKLSNQHRQQIFISGFGNNIDPEGEPFTKMVTIRTDRLNSLQEIVPEDFYITVGAGFPLREINTHLAKYNLWLPHASLSYPGSVGGSIAAGFNAQLQEHELPLKKYLIKAEIVTPQGDIIKVGSVSFKSVSGYDIVKIFFGSWGLLGLIVSATFRIMPISAKNEFSHLRQKAIDRTPLLTALDEANNDTSAVYSRKIKAKFDPNQILPVIKNIR